MTLEKIEEQLATPCRRCAGTTFAHFAVAGDVFWCRACGGSGKNRTVRRLEIGYKTYPLTKLVDQPPYIEAEAEANKG